MKKLSFAKIGRLAVPAIVVAAFAVGALITQGESATSVTGVILVEKSALFNESKAGQDIANQIAAQRKAIDDEFGKRAEKLKLEEDQLANQQSMLSQEAFAAKVKEAQDKHLALQREADVRVRQLQAGILNAQNKIWQAASPLLDALLKEKQANLMLDRAAVVKGSADLDVTAIAIDRLNQKLPTVKLELAAASAQGAGTKQKAPGQ